MSVAWKVILFLILIGLLIFGSSRSGYIDLTPAKVATSPRSPYSLLPLPTKNGSTVADGPTSEQCYKTDFQASDKVTLLPSYAQTTNNYKHKNGESCSAPNHDLILGIYR